MIALNEFAHINKIVPKEEESQIIQYNMDLFKCGHIPAASF